MSTTATTPRVRLSLSEFLDLLLGLCAVVGALLKVVLSTAPPWPWRGALHRRGQAQAPARTTHARDYWRGVCVALLRAASARLSIRQLQYVMPGTAHAVRTWSRARRVDVGTDVVPPPIRSPMEGRTRAPVPAPVVHWIGGRPGERGMHEHGRVLFFLHGGGFVLPMSDGQLDMLWYIRNRLHSELSCAVHIAAVEYSLAPHSRQPVQLEQVVQSLVYLLAHYRIPPSSLVIAGDSAGGALCMSALSHVLHPHPSISVPPPRLAAPLAGVLLLSPWTSFATTSGSYRENAAHDALTPGLTRRFRGAFLSGTDALPATSDADAWRHASANRDPPAPSNTEADPVLFEPSVTWNGVARAGYWLQASEAPADWWAGIEDVASRVMITAGILECFRDDILALEATLRALKKRDGTGPALAVSSFLDNAVHAVPVNDFAFGVEPGEQMEEIIMWLKQTFRPQE